MTSNQRVKIATLLATAGMIFLALSLARASVLTGPAPTLQGDRSYEAAPAVIAGGALTETPRVYPNPWRADRDHDKTITFDHLLPNATLKIFTIDARLVRTLDASAGSTSWDGTNESGEKVASGVYLYVVEDILGQQFRGKFAIIR